MGGNAFDNVQSITLDEYKPLIRRIESALRACGATYVVPLGSTGKAELMGDIDVCIDKPSRDVLQARLHDYPSKCYGSSQLTLVWPVSKHKSTQVDITIGDAKWLTWSKFGTPDAAVKGVVRNLFLNSLLREKGTGDDFDRKRLLIDWDRGMFEATQTRRKKGGGSLERWKTLDSRLVTDDPDQVLNTIFGSEYSSVNILRFEDAVAAVKATHSDPEGVLRSFVQEAEELVSRESRTLGSRPQQTLIAIKRIALG